MQHCAFINLLTEWLIGAQNTYKHGYNKLATNYRENNHTISVVLFKSNSTVKEANHGAGRGSEEAAATRKAS